MHFVPSNAQPARYRWFYLQAIRPIAACLGLMAPILLISGCGKTEVEKAQAKASLVREIGLPPPETQSSSAPTPPKVVKDDATQPWLETDPLSNEHWEIQYIGNRPVGFAHRLVTPSQSLGEGTYRLEAESRTRFKKGDEEVEQRVQVVTFERENGELLLIEGSVQIGEQTRRFEGKIRENALQLNTNIDGRGTVIKIPWSATDRGPFAIEQSLVRAPMKENESRELRYFDPIQGKMIDVQLRAYDYFATPTFDGSKERLLEIQINSFVADAESSSQLWVDSQGRSHKSYLPAIDLRSFRCDPSSARFVVAKSDLNQLTLGDITLFRARPSQYETGPVTYRIETLKPQSTIDVSSRTNQRAHAINPRKVDVTVYPATLLDPPVDGIELEPVPDPTTLSDSPLIQANHPQIQRLAALLLQTNGLSSQDPRTTRAAAIRTGIAERLPTVAFDREVSTGPQTLANGNGDAFDHAVLLASTCRADGIPARIAIGLIYNQSTARPAMGLHAWVEFHDGLRWVPIDSSRPDNTVAADRVKWGEFAFETMNPYDAILSLGRKLSDLEIAVLPGSK